MFFVLFVFILYKEHNTENLKDYQYRCQEKQNKEHNTENLKDYQYRCQKKQDTE
jgi:hypothetical protein